MDRKSLAVAAMCTFLSTQAFGQCQEGLWIIDKDIEQFDVGTVHDSLFLDPDGPGPAVAKLIVATTCLVAGQPTGRVLERGETGWIQLGDSKPGSVRRLMSSGGGLFAIWVNENATSSSVLRWDSAGWVTLDGEPGTSTANGEVRCMIEVGGDLLVGGYFSVIGGVGCPGCAQWDGFVWKPVLAPNAPTEKVVVLDFFMGHVLASAVNSAETTKMHQSGPSQAWLPPFGEVKNIDMTDVAEFQGLLIAGSPNSTFVPPDGTQAKAQGLAYWSGQYWEEVNGFKGGTPRDLEISTGGDLVVGGKSLNVPSLNGSDNASLLIWNGSEWRNPLPKLEPSSDVYTVSATTDGGFVVGGGLAFAGDPPNTFWHVATWTPAQCYADCDCSKVLSIDDFICFQTFFALGDPYADCDADGSLSIDDFICFQTLFAIGC